MSRGTVLVQSNLTRVERKKLKVGEERSWDKNALFVR